MKIELVFGFVTSFLFLIGKAVYKTHHIESILYKPVNSLFTFLWMGILCSVIYVALNAASSVLSRKKETNYEDKNQRNKNVVTALIMFAALFIVYLACLLAFYPGIFAADLSQTYQVLGLEKWTNMHPVLHTLLWKFCIFCGNYIGNRSLFIYEIIQMTIVLCSCTYLLYSMMRERLPKILIIGTFLYYFLTPSMHISSLLMTKDVLFSCFVLLFAISVRELEQKCNKKNQIKVAIFGTLAILFRNNMILILIVLMLIYLFLKIENKKQILLSLSSVLAIGGLFFLIIVPKYLDDPTSSYQQESFSVILSQMAYTYNENPELLNESEKGRIRAYIPFVEQYEPRFGDYVKSGFNTSYYAENPKAFWSIYLKTFLKDPAGYVSAFLDLNIYYWYPFYDVEDPQYRGKYDTGIPYDDNFLMIRDSKNIPLQEYYEKVSRCEFGWMKLPVIKNYYTVAFPFLTLLISLFFVVKNQKKALISSFCIFAVLWVGYLFGPVALYRYVYTFFLAFPMYMSYSIVKGN